MTAAAPPRPDAANAGKPAGAGARRGLVGRITSSKVRLGISVSVTMALVSGLFWTLTRPEPLTPAQALQKALDELGDRGDVLARERAREAARELQRLDRDPDFPGGPEFILGVVAFRDAEDAEESARERQHLAAIQLLRDASARGLPDDRQPEWSLALGTSLSRVGSPTAARPLLEQAVASGDEARAIAAPLLIDIYLDLKTRPELDQAIELARDLAQKSRSPQHQDRAWLQLAQALMALNRPQEAEAALKEVSEQSWSLGTRVFNAQTRMARGEYREAYAELERVAADTGLERMFPRQASYLMGVCAERQGTFETAIACYERTAERFERSHEALAARLRAANLLRAVGRNEEALTAYRRVLRSIRDPADFRNRWITIDEFRQMVVEGWNGWMGQRRYAEAIDLTAMMTPLVPVPQARDLRARTLQAWAQSLDAAYQASRFEERRRLLPDLLQHWRDSAQAWADVADVQQTSPSFPDILWTSSEQFERGRDFRRALEQLDAFVGTNPQRLLPLAVLRRGALLLEMDQPARALAEFHRVIAEFPTDPAVFEARYFVGRTRLEQGDLAGAEAAWQAVLTSTELTPDAEQWRLSLFSLGRMRFHRATRAASQARSLEISGAPADNVLASRKAAYSDWDESSQRLDEYVRRYPDSPETYEARFLLAGALKQSAGLPRDRLRTAETENARQELRRAMDRLLTQANEEFLRLRTDLMDRIDAGQADDLARQMQRECSFEIAHTFYDLGQFDKAIVAYNGAINRFPQDPQALLAYLQMTQCYDRLGKSVEARSMLQQARIILNGLPDDAFPPDRTSMSRDDWARWIDWTSRLNDPTSPGSGV